MAVTEITKENFKSFVLDSNKPVLIDFWAPWCGPCRMVSPIVDELAEDLDGKANIGKINVDEQPDLAAQYGIMSIPTLLVFKGGELVRENRGSDKTGFNGNARFVNRTPSPNAIKKTLFYYIIYYNGGICNVWRTKIFHL